MLARRVVGVLAVLLAGCGIDSRLARQENAPLVFAAASLKTALDDVEPLCQSEIGVGFRASYAASSALARQIEAGAPADLFISADLDWMDYVAGRELVQTATRTRLLGNRLVLVAPAGRAPALDVEPGFPLVEALGEGRLALADPEVVPAGKYAKAALTHLGVWADVAGRLAPAENVRSALMVVSRGEAPLGVVYRSDAMADPEVEVVDTFPPNAHPPIVYLAALTNVAGGPAERVLNCLSGPGAAKVFERWGFVTSADLGATPDFFHGLRGP